MRLAILRQPTGSPTPAAFPSETWTPTTPTAVPSITASPPTCASASATTTSSSRPTPGRTPSTIRPICSPRSRRKTVTTRHWIAPIPCSTSATASSSAASTRRASSAEAALAASSSATGPSLPSSRSLPAGPLTSPRTAATTSRFPLSLPAQTLPSTQPVVRLSQQILAERHLSGALHQRLHCRWHCPTLLQLDGNLGRNAGITPWTLFDDVRFAKRIYFGERYNMDLITDMFNIANR